MALILGGLSEVPSISGDEDGTVTTPAWDWEGLENPAIFNQRIDAAIPYVFPPNSEGFTTDEMLNSGTHKVHRLPFNVSVNNGSAIRANATEVETTSPSGFIINRLHFTPIEVDFGVITGFTTRYVEMWAPMLRNSDTLQSIAPTDLDGVTIDPSIPVPSELYGYGVYTLEVSVIPEGDRLIEGYFDFTLDYLPDAVLPVVGRRSLVYSFPHNWTEDVVESYQWKTSVLTSDTGDEARAPLRYYPRMTVTNTSLINKDMFQTFKTYMSAWHAKDYTLPLWHRQEKLQSKVLSGSTILDLPVEHMNLKVGSAFMIGYDWDDYEVKQVEELLGGTSVKTTSPFNSSWNAGARAVPVTAAVIRQPARISGITSNVASAAGVFFEVDYSQEALQTPVVTGLIETYKGSPVVPLRPDRGQDMPTVFSRPMVTKVDYLAGAPMFFDNMDFTPMETFCDFLIQNLNQLYKLKEFMYECQGKHKSQWLPSYDQDFTLVEYTAETSGVLKVESNDYATLVNMQADRKHLYIEWLTGEIFMTEIIGVEVDTEGYTIFSLADALPQDLSPNQVKYFSYLYRTRLSSDTVTINYLTNESARCLLAFTTLKA